MQDGAAPSSVIALDTSTAALTALPPELINLIVRFTCPHSFHSIDTQVILSRVKALKVLSLVRPLHDAAQNELFAYPFVRIDRLGRLFIDALRRGGGGEGRERWRKVREIRLEGYHVYSGTLEEILRVCEGVEKVWLRFFQDAGRGLFLKSKALRTLVLDYSHFNHSLGFPTFLPTSLTQLYIIGTSTSPLLLQSITPDRLPSLELLFVTDIQDHHRPAMIDTFRLFNATSLKLLVLRLHEFQDLPLPLPNLTTSVMWTVTPGTGTESFDWYPKALSFRHLGFVTFLPDQELVDIVLGTLEAVSQTTEPIHIKRIYVPKSVLLRPYLRSASASGGFEMERRRKGGVESVWEALLRVGDKCGIEVMDTGVRISSDLPFVMTIAEEAVEWERSGGA